MSVVKTGVVNGSAISGFTSPTYTLTQDTAPDNTVSAYVSAVGGTQAGVTAHSYSKPFTVTWRRPGTFRTFLSAVYNAATGQYSKVPYNEFVCLVRCASAYANGQNGVNEIRKRFRLYTNTETFDLPMVKAMLSFEAGYAVANTDNAVTLFTTGSL